MKAANTGTRQNSAGSMVPYKRRLCVVVEDVSIHRPICTDFNTVYADVFVIVGFRFRAGGAMLPRTDSH